MSTPQLAFDQITFGYGPHGPAVLDAFELQIPPDTVTAILGPNGAGKSTLLHLALGWLAPQRGQVRLEGRPLSGYPRRELGQRMALVPQSERIPFEYSLLEYVLLGRAPYLAPLQLPGEEDCRIARSALEQVGLGRLMERSITSLSGGERQLAMVARALAQSPRLLLLDEPTAHLDLANKVRLIELLRALRRQGVSLLLTTHEPEVASALATHLVLMCEGRVLHAGAFREVFTAGRLEETYGVPLSVADVAGQPVVVWHARPAA